MVCSFCIVLLCVFIPSKAQAGLRLPASGQIALDRHWELLLDPQDTLTVEQMAQPEIAAAFVPQTAPPALGYRHGSVWLRITLSRPAQGSPQWLLQLRSALLDDVTLYTPRPGGGYSVRVAGDRQPIAGRDIFHRTPVFLLNLPPDQPVTVYLRVRSTSTLSFPLTIWSPDAFIGVMGTEQLLFGLFYATHLILLMVCGWFYWVTRHRSFGLFSLTVLANLFTSLSAEGFTYQYLLPVWPLLADALYVVSWFAAVPLGVLFTLHYLGLFDSRWRRWVRGFSHLTWVIAAVAAPFLVVVNIWWLRPLMVLWQTVAIGVLLYLSGWMTWRGHRPARVILLVLTLLIGGTVLRLARNVGWIDPGVFVDNANYLGMMAFLLIMNSAISRQYNDMLTQKELAQTDALRVARQAERDLEAKVAMRTQALREAMARVEVALSLERQAQEEQRQFLATVSHELRTPLAVIDITAQNLELDNSEVDPQTSARYKKILRATQRMTLLLNDSLHESCFELLHKGARPTPVDLASLLEDAAAAAHLLSEGHTPEVDAQELPKDFQCDGSLLRLVLRSLADNAVKYTPAGSRVTLRGRTVAHGVELEVQDDGPGIPLADLPHIFERFYRGRNAGRKPGTGLGLPLALRMVEIQGGTLTLESTPGHGCLVRIFLPTEPRSGALAPDGAVPLPA